MTNGSTDNNDTIQEILETSLHKIYGERIKKLEIVKAMPYPLRENLYIATYNLHLEGQVPIMRAKIVVDTATAELKPFDPGLQ